MLQDMLESKSVFIFDLDGTLIDSLGIWNETDKTFIHNVTGIVEDTSLINARRDAFLGETKEADPYLAYVHYLLGIYKIKGDPEKMLKYRREIAAELTNTIKLKHYAKETLSLLKKLGYKVCLATTGANESVRKILYENPFTSFLGDYEFDGIMTQKDVKTMKPSPEIHLKLKELLKFREEEAVVVEDSYVGVNAATNANIDCIVVKEELTSEQEYLRNWKYYIESLEILYKNIANLPKNKEKMQILGKIGV